MRYTLSWRCHLYCISYFCRLKTVWTMTSWTVSVGCTAVLICLKLSNSPVRAKNTTERTCTIRITSGSPFSWLLMPDFFTFQDASGWLLKEGSCLTWSKVNCFFITPEWLGVSGQLKNVCAQVQMNIAWMLLVQQNINMARCFTLCPYVKKILFFLLPQKLCILQCLKIALNVLILLAFSLG